MAQHWPKAGTIEKLEEGRQEPTLLLYYSCVRRREANRHQCV